MFCLKVLTHLVTHTYTIPYTQHTHAALFSEIHLEYNTLNTGHFRTDSLCTVLHAWTHTTHLEMYTHTHAHTCTHMRTHAPTQAPAHAPPHTHVRACTHTHTHTHTCAHTASKEPWRLPRAGTVIAGSWVDPRPATGVGSQHTQFYLTQNTTHYET